MFPTKFKKIVVKVYNWQQL